MAEIDGPRIEPKSRNARQLVVLLHGYGATGNDAIDIGRTWQDRLPDTAFVSPHAPEPSAQVPFGRQWFGRSSDPYERWNGATAARPALDGFLDSELTRWNLPPSALALVGFSQGAVMALHVALRRAVTPLAVVGYSGMLVVPNDGPMENIAPEITARPPVLLVHGDSDAMIPLPVVFRSAERLAALDVPVEWHILSGVGHGINAEGLDRGSAFLAKQFASRADAPPH